VKEEPVKKDSNISIVIKIVKTYCTDYPEECEQ